MGALGRALDELIAIETQLNGRQEVNSRPWNANAFTSYRFSSGPLADLTIGGGVNHRGDAILGLDQSDPFNHKTVKGNSYYLANAMLAYDLNSRGKIGARLQFNVDNPLDKDDLQVLAPGRRVGSFGPWSPNDLKRVGINRAAL